MMHDPGRRPARSSTAARRQLGLELRRLREQAGLLGDEVARALYWSTSKVSRYESAKTVASPGEVVKLLDYYGITGTQREHLVQFAHTANEASWWDAYAADLPTHQRDLIGLEHAAADILIWSAGAVPALLQTEAYACHIVSSRGRVEPIAPQQAARLATVTKLRQQLLTRADPPKVTAVLDEAILRRPAGDAQVMSEQLRRLAELADGHPAVTLQVLPLAAQLPVFAGSFTILSLGPAQPNSVLQHVVAVDHFTGAGLVEDERGAYLYGLAFGCLAEAALDPETSKSLIQELAR